MPLPDKYKNILMMWKKLIAGHVLLLQEFSLERFNEFALTPYHLHDWVRADSAASAAAKADADALMTTIELQACRDAANTYKHRKPGRPPGNSTNDTDVDQGFGVGGFGNGGFGVGEEQATITMLDGTVFDGLDLSHRVYKLWTDYFDKHPTLLGLQHDVPMRGYRVIPFIGYKSGGVKRRFGQTQSLSPVNQCQRIAELLDTLEMSCVARHQFEVVFQGNRRNHRVSETDGASEAFQFTRDPARHDGGGLFKWDNFHRRKRGDKGLQAANALLFLKATDDFRDRDCRESITAEGVAVGGGIAGNDLIDSYTDF